MDRMWYSGKSIVDLAIEEDLGTGDVTTDAMVELDVPGKALLLARQRAVLAGLFVFKYVMKRVDRDISFEDRCKEGDMLQPDSVVTVIKGSIASILKAERTALNFLQRMSGIATLTYEYAERVRQFNVKILDTRKTAPGLRWFDKYAVRMGGGTNHRYGLFDGILIKDNHIAAAGSIARAVRLARENAPHTLKIEVEVEDLEGVRQALEAGADVIMLDNMSLDDMSRAVSMISGRAITEASGGVTLNTVADIARTGVDLISVGALTHSAQATDFSLEIIR